MICRQLTEPGDAQPAGTASAARTGAVAATKQSTAVIASLRIADPLSVVPCGDFRSWARSDGPAIPGTGR
ncbi:hypothetical protein GCM10010483_62660 [Actinokineospora diospyrosa]